MADDPDPTPTKPTPAIHRMTEEELRQFVKDYLANLIFTSANLRDQNLLPMVFMPLMFGALDSFTEESVKDVGIIWEYTREAGPRGVNGNPTFFSMHIMHQLDWERALAAIKREQERVIDV